MNTPSAVNERLTRRVERFLRDRKREAHRTGRTELRVDVYDVANRLNVTTAAVRSVLTQLTRVTGSGLVQRTPTEFEYRFAARRAMDSQVDVKAVRYVQSRPYELVTVSEAVQATGCLPTSLSAALMRATKEPRWADCYITRVRQGVYSYRPPKKGADAESEPDDVAAEPEVDSVILQNTYENGQENGHVGLLLHEVGSLSSGAFIAEDAGGHLYECTRLR